MTSADSICYTLISAISLGDSEGNSEQALKADIECAESKKKIEALKKVILMTINGERFQPSLLMHIIKYLLPSRDHTIKKLLLVFWEICSKTDENGNLRQEMILVCDAYRRDLAHPNEFIRGSTLRFLCKLKHPELLEPLMPTIRLCLDHRHSYVRRNAILAIYTIYQNFDSLIPDACELMLEFLQAEKDASCKRNAFMFLKVADQERALEYLASCIDQVQSFNEILQLQIVELVYKVCHANPTERARFIRCIYNLLQSTAPSVRYEAAWTLVTLSTAPTAVKAAANTYIELIVKESDNNVKLIVLDRLIELSENPETEKVLQGLLMDILRGLTSPDLEVKKKTLNLALDLVSSRNVEELVKYLEKEVMKTENVTEHDDTDKYRQLLVRALHTCSVRYSDIAPQVIPILMNFLSDTSEIAAVDVMLFVREAVHRYDELKPMILDKLLECFPTIRNMKILRSSLWILGEYCTEKEHILHFMQELDNCMGTYPIVESEIKRAAGEEVVQEKQVDESTPQQKKEAQSARKVTEMGTYATQSALVLQATKKGKKEKRPSIRGFLLDGEFFLSAVLSTTLTKIALRYATAERNTAHQNLFVGKCMLIMASCLHLGQSGLSKTPISDDDADRIATCIRILAESTPVMNEIFGGECRNALEQLLALKEAYEQENKKNCGKKVRKVEPDEPIAFQVLTSLTAGSGSMDALEMSLSAALGTSGISKEREEKPKSLATRLNKVTQLTGFSDPIYAEAYVTVNQFDILLDVLVVNQTSDTLQNCSLELATLGDLKLVEKPSPMTLAPHDFVNIKASVKVTSTENGIIFGNIAYDISGAGSDRCCVVLNEIHIDVMDYVHPASCQEPEFRQLWAEFEWENKVTVNTNIVQVREYLDHVCSETNMKCITPERAISGECGFLTANLYCKSLFGEAALANLSIELVEGLNDGPDVLIGHIRIRAKSQGMALSLGDKIGTAQKKKIPRRAVEPPRPMVATEC